ncbi:hypothetical protein LZ30DRAFT_423492 [Colletotrichum cereale]|nr:hypothetical protein LZ30DRAFT_423492 [Colletotrichum cereale]
MRSTTFEERLLTHVRCSLGPHYPQEPNDPARPRQHGYLPRHALPRRQHGPRNARRVRGAPEEQPHEQHPRRGRRGRCQPHGQLRHGRLLGGHREEGRVLRLRVLKRRRRRRRQREEGEGCAEVRKRAGAAARLWFTRRERLKPNEKKGLGGCSWTSDWTTVRSSGAGEEWCAHLFLYLYSDTLMANRATPTACRACDVRT